MMSLYNNGTGLYSSYAGGLFILDGCIVWDSLISHYHASNMIVLQYQICTLASVTTYKTI